MQGTIDKKILQTLFYEQIKKRSPAMNADIGHHDRCPPDHQRKNYDWLAQRVQAYLFQKRRAENRENQVKGAFVSGGAPSAPATPAASTGPAS
jgi:hypothetical protein